jgi:hypothetical protein
MINSFNDSFMEAKGRHIVDGEGAQDTGAQGEATHSVE